MIIIAMLAAFSVSAANIDMEKEDTRLDDAIARSA